MQPIPPIGLLFRTCLARIFAGSPINFNVELRQQALEPARMSGDLDSHPYLFPLQLTIEVLSLSPILQPPFTAFSCFRVHPADLLPPHVLGGSGKPLAKPSRA